jgi:hypothetical protein
VDGLRLIAYGHTLFSPPKGGLYTKLIHHTRLVVVCQAEAAADNAVTEPDLE